jgi:hypothetical protein
MKAMTKFTLLVSLITLVYSCGQEQTILNDATLSSKKEWQSIDELKSANVDSVYKINLSGKDLTQVPKDIWKFKKVQILNLSNNSIQEIPAEIKNLKNLQILDLRNNKISSIADQLNNLKYLTSIKLSGNHIADITTNFESLENLNNLQLTESIEQDSVDNDDLKVIEMAYIYRKIGEEALYKELINTSAPLTPLAATNRDCNNILGRPRRIPIWEYSRIEVGFIPPVVTADPEIISIKSASSIQPDVSLKNSKLNVYLGYLRSFDYPGKGVHNAFLGYTVSTIGATSAPDKEYSFNQSFKVNEQDEPSLRTVPVFIGLPTGQDGILIRCDVFNVSNENDEKVSRVFSVGEKGLEILGLTQINPAIGMVKDVAKEALNLIKSNHENIKIHEVKLGLNFSNNGSDLQLAKGTYIILNIPNCVNGNQYEFKWDNFKFLKSNGKIQDKDGGQVKLNYIVFTIS